MQLEVKQRYRYFLGPRPANLDESSERKRDALERDPDKIFQVINKNQTGDYTIALIRSGTLLRYINLNNVNIVSVIPINQTKLTYTVQPLLEIGKTYKYILKDRPILPRGSTLYKVRDMLEKSVRKDFLVLDREVGNNPIYTVKIANRAEIVRMNPMRMNILVDILSPTELNKQRANLTQRLFAQHDLPTSKSTGPIGKVFDFAGIKTPKNRYGGKKRKTRRR